MSYSENTRRASTERAKRAKRAGRRLVISWVVIAAVFLCAGFGTGYATRGTEVSRHAKTTTVYGSVSERENGEETSEEWLADGASFEMVEDADMDKDMQEYVFYISKAYGVDFTFVMALIQQESGYDPKAVSDTGDYGLMQINEINTELITKTLSTEDLLDPYQNVEAGVWILHKLFEKYVNPSKVLMAYNLGETGASILWDKGIYETDYSRSVIEAQDEMIDKMIEKELKEDGKDD